MASRNHSAVHQEEVITNLVECFGSVVTVDVIRNVAYNCKFNLETASEKLIDLSSRPNRRQSALVARGPSQCSMDDVYQKELSIQRVIDFVKEGWKVLILLRGLPGSGKTHLANLIFKEAVPSYNKQDFILSTDDYFCKSGTYSFNPQNLQDAHTSNQRRCFINMKKGISPIIIDNTNTQLWEMRPYCLMAAEFGYCIELLEPTTSWANNVQILAKKNIHGVGKEKLYDMLFRFEKNLNPEIISRLCNLQYKVSLPQKRRIPSHIPAKRDVIHVRKESPVWNLPVRMLSAERAEIMESAAPLEYVHPVGSKREAPWIGKPNFPEYIHEFKTTDHMRDRTKDQKPADQSDYLTRLARVDDLLAFQSDLKQDEADKSIDILLDLTATNAGGEVSRDQRPNNSMEIEELLTNEFSKLEGARLAEPLEISKDEKTSNPYPIDLQAWGVTERALVSWEVVSPLPPVNSPESPSTRITDGNGHDVAVEKSNRGTNTSVSDFNIVKQSVPEDGVKILISQNRIITEGIPAKQTTSPPKKILVDASSMTNEEVLIAALKRENPCAEHLEKLVQMFPEIPREFLSDFYDKCVRDLNWTIDLLMENGPENLCTPLPETKDVAVAENSAVKEEDVSEEKMDDLISFEVEPTEETPLIENDTERIERELLKQQEREQLKRHLEESIDIKKEHYSDKLWQIVNFRRGTPVKSDDIQTIDAQPTIEDTPSTSFQNDVYEDNTVFVSDDECEFVNNADEEGEPESLIEINLGRELVGQLVQMFGGAEEQIQPMVQMPESVARQLHALYLESISRYLENQRDCLEKEDEAIAKKLQEQEEKTLIQNQKTSNLKEIMDEQFALNLYQKDVEKWREISPDDLASRLTRQKLIENFPNIDKNLLVELLQAHNNNYRQTVETLLDSTKPQDEQTANEANLKEPPISDGTLQEMKLAQEAVTKTVNPNEVRTGLSYRKEANEHMNKRKENLQKAQMYNQRGMSEVAGFYASIARQQRQLAELANQKASNRFIEENAVKLTSSTTLDLHYLYVVEALQTLDIFIDNHISCLVKDKKVSEHLYIITGRGKRSEGGVSKLKPAVIRRLKKRSIQFHHVNEGLLRIKIHKNLLMSTHLMNGN